MERHHMIAEITIQKIRRSNIINPVFSILIPSWNNLAYLKLCIESIRSHSHFRHQVIVHINENRDGTLEWVKSQDDLDYSFSEENIGVCYALNIGRGLAVTEYILYMNDDMYACPGWDLVLYDEIRKIGHPYFYISSTAIEPVANGNPCVIQLDCGKDILSFDDKKLLAEFAKPAMNDWQGSTWPPNVVHRELWDLVGGYSPEFSPGMYSDPDFSMKLWLAGVRLFKGLGRSRVYHFGSKSTKRVRKNKGYYRFIEKWGMTSSTLTTHFLRRGKPYDGLLQEPVLPMGIKLKNLLKRIRAAFLHI